MTQGGGLPREAAASERMRRPLFLCPEAEPGGEEDGLSHFVAHCRKNEDFEQKLCYFPLLQIKGGGGYNLKKCALHKKERKKDKKV